MGKRSNLLGKLFKKPRKNIVIAVHGLGNKPPMGLLSVWWKHSIIEGLRKIEGSNRKFSFRMVYWADIMYAKPLNPRIKDPGHPLHIEEPYIPEPIPSPAIRHTPWHYVKLAWERIKATLFLSRHGLANHRVLFDMVVRSSFKDLAAYYDSESSDEDKLDMAPVKAKIRQRLRTVLQKHKDDNILIIAHSMGALIAYDVLYRLPEQYNIEVFITMGSPMGLPVLREKIAEDHNLTYDDETLLPTPESIKNWPNFSDKDDHFAVFDDLSSFYAPNARGAFPKDIPVINDYKDWVTNNAHKSFGYLRTPELAQVVADFLGYKKQNLWQKGKKLLKRKRKKG